MRLPAADCGRARRRLGQGTCRSPGRCPPATRCSVSCATASAPGTHDSMTQKGRRTPADDLLARLSTTPQAYPQKLDLSARAGWSSSSTRPHTGPRASSMTESSVRRRKAPGCPSSVYCRRRARDRDPRPLHFIFHTGHVGSTLVSRLLDETGAVLSLREPSPLRTLAETSDALHLPESRIGQARFDELLDGAAAPLEPGLCRHPLRGREGDQQRSEACARDSRRVRRRARSTSTSVRNLRSRHCSRDRTRRSTCEVTVPSGCAGSGENCTHRFHRFTRCRSANWPR